MVMRFTGKQISKRIRNSRNDADIRDYLIIQLFFTRPLYVIGEFGPILYLGVQVKILCHKDSKDLVQVSNSREVQGAPIVSNLVPGLGEGVSYQVKDGGTSPLEWNVVIFYACRQEVRLKYIGKNN